MQNRSNSGTLRFSTPPNQTRTLPFKNMAIKISNVKSHHTISVKCSRYQDTRPTNPPLHMLLTGFNFHVNKILLSQWETGKFAVEGTDTDY